MDDKYLDAVASSMANVLSLLGEDPQRPGLHKTPLRVARALQELTSGYQNDIEAEIAVFDAEGADQMVCQWNIPLYSLCEHHMLPFTGYAHIGYIPREYVLGLSKLKRITDHFARRLQIQERLTREIADYIEGAVHPRGVMVVVEAEHLCMTMRGVQAPGTKTTTSAVTGVFTEPAEGSRDEFLTLLSNQRRDR